MSTFIDFYVAPKLKFCINPNAKYKVAINTQYIYIIDWHGNEKRKYNFTFVQGLITKGNEENNITLGVGQPLANDWLNINYFITLAFKKKLSNRLSFVSDNLLLTNKNSNTATTYIFSGGFRIDGKNHAFDFGIFTPPLNIGLQNVYIPIPFISYSLRVSR